jgi:hypothetical protein
MSTAGEAATLNNAISDPAPEAQVAFDGHYELLRGLRDTSSGAEVWHTTAFVRELTGEDEEFLASIEKKPDLTYTDYMNALLGRSVVTIGDIAVEGSADVLNKLILADRDILFLATAKSTYGRVRELRSQCSACGAWNDIEIDLVDDFPIQNADFDVKTPIRVELSKGVTVHLRLPNAADTIAAQKDSKTEAEVNTVMLSRCAVWDDDDAPADPLEWARTLNLSDRKKLVRALVSTKIGPEMKEVETHCASCGADMPLLMDWVSLLLG